MAGNIVTNWSFQNASGVVGSVAASSGGGTGGSGGTGGTGGSGGSGPYLVQPVAWWASDTANDSSIWQASQGLSTPYSAATYRSIIDQNVLYVQRWYYDRFDGYTFDFLPSVIYNSPETKAQLQSSMPGIEHFHQGMLVADNTLTSIDVTDLRRLHYMVTPLPNIAASYPGVLGRTENFYAFPYDSDGGADLPAVCAQWDSGFGNNLGRDLGAFTNPLASGNADLACAVFAHEIGHVFGYSLGNANADHLYPHETATPLTGSTNLMAPGIAFITSCGVTAAEKAAFKASPFLTFHSTRP